MLCLKPHSKFCRERSVCQESRSFFLLTSAGRLTPARSVFNHPHGVLRRRSGGWKEPAGPEDHRRKQRGVQPLGLSVQQPGEVSCCLASPHSPGKVVKPEETASLLGGRGDAPHRASDARQSAGDRQAGGEPAAGTCRGRSVGPGRALTRAGISRAGQTQSRGGSPSCSVAVTPLPHRRPSQRPSSYTLSAGASPRGDAGGGPGDVVSGLPKAVGGQVWGGVKRVTFIPLLATLIQEEVGEVSYSMFFT